MRAETRACLTLMRTIFSSHPPARTNLQHPSPALRESSRRVFMGTTGGSLTRQFIFNGDTILTSLSVVGVLCFFKDNLAPLPARFT